MSNPKKRDRSGQPGTFDRWTDTGLDCDAIGSDCSRCFIAKTYGFACHQAKINQSLKERGILKPVVEVKVFKSPWRKKRETKPKAQGLA